MFYAVICFLFFVVKSFEGKGGCIQINVNPQLIIIHSPHSLSYNSYDDDNDDDNVANDNNVDDNCFGR